MQPLGPRGYPELSGTAWILYAMGRLIKRGRTAVSRFLAPYQKGLAGMGRYLAWDGSLFNVSTEGTLAKARP